MRHPDAKIYVFMSWKEPPLEKLAFAKRIGLPDPYEIDVGHYFLIDNARGCYWNSELWIWCKRLLPTTRVLFPGDSILLYDNILEGGLLPHVLCKARLETRNRNGTLIGPKADKDEHEGVYPADQIYTYAAGNV
jgi:hypothetical protein